MINSQTELMPLMLPVCVALSLLFATMFLVGERIKNAGVIDCVWAFSFVGVMAYLVTVTHGWFPRQLLLVLLITFEYGRLGTTITRRFLHEHPKEDARYAYAKQNWGALEKPLMFLAYQLQWILIALLFVPIVMLLQFQSPFFSPWEWLGYGVAITGFVIETMADQQLAQFKALKLGPVCNVGLWKYSRHPNYFGQWLIWLGLTLAAQVVPGGLFTWYVPVLMLLFLTKLTGIALTETHMLASRGDVYAQYQATTSAFFPLPPKHN